MNGDWFVNKVKIFGHLKAWGITTFLVINHHETGASSKGKKISVSEEKGYLQKELDRYVCYTLATLTDNFFHHFDLGKLVQVYSCMFQGEADICGF